MTLEIRQECDVCGNIRVFPVTDLRRFTGIQEAAARDGWVCLNRDTNKHMCPHCVKSTLDKAKGERNLKGPTIEIVTNKEQQ